MRGRSARGNHYLEPVLGRSFSTTEEEEEEVDVDEEDP
jgi:hypothetical protein